MRVRGSSQGNGGKLKGKVERKESHIRKKKWKKRIKVKKGLKRRVRIGKNLKSNTKKS